MTSAPNASTSAPISRRRWLDLALMIGGAIGGLGMAVPAALYLWPARATGPGQSTVKAGPLDAIPVGGAKLIQAGGQPIILVRSGPDTVSALSAICTHLGCVVQWDHDRNLISCPCHGGEFSREGLVLAGPPPRPLPSYPVMIVNGQLQVRIA
jgi:cytochrome b6-f complex iron-sulfur subunit